MAASSLESHEVVLFSNVYAPINLPRKSLLWSHVKFFLSLAPYLPLILTREFNAISCLEEKRGGIAHLEPSSKHLRDNVKFVNLVDIKPNKRVFT